MVTRDPLEPLRQAYQEINTWVGQERYFLQVFREQGQLFDDKVRGEVGALFAHFDQLRRDNEAALQDELDTAAQHLRKNIGRKLNTLIETLDEFKRL